MTKKLYRSQTDRMISGVCGGIAEYANIDPTIIRLIAVVIIISSAFTALVAYLICAIVIPEGSNHYTDADYYESSHYDNDSHDHDTQKKTKKIIGILLLALGIILLSKNFIWYDKDIVISLGLMVIGVFLIFGFSSKKPIS